MARLVLRSSIPRKILITACCLLVWAWIQTPVALAQHGGGHVGGGGVHFSTGGRIAPPHVSAPPSSHGIWHPHFWSGPPAAGVGAGNIRFRHPIHPLPPVFPIYGYPYFFGGPFFGYGWGWGFTSIWWPTCGPYWGWQFGCNSLPFYEYGWGNYAPFYSPSVPSGAPTYEYPLYPYREEGRDLPQLYLKDGTVYSVTDYWLVNGQIHFTTNEATEEGGLKSVEHVIDFDQLDLQTTIDVNTERGFRFVLRNEPLEQYMRDHPDATAAPPVSPPPDNQ